MDYDSIALPTELSRQLNYSLIYLPFKKNQAENKKKSVFLLIPSSLIKIEQLFQSKTFKTFYWKTVKSRLKNLQKVLYCFIMMNREILIITDSHLTEHCPERTVFRFLLEKISESDYDVLFLGDIFDIWIGCKGYETSVHREFMEWCSKEKNKRKLWYIEGNHEFFIHRNRSGYFTEVFQDFALLDGNVLFAAHGDRVNHHDKAYAFLRGLLRNPVSYFVLKLFGYTGFGSSFSGKVRKDLQRTNQKQRFYFPETELKELDQSLQSGGVESAVLGHFHHNRVSGNITVLANFTEENATVGLYKSGNGIEYKTVRDLFGEWK